MDTCEWFEPIDRYQEGLTSLIIQYSYNIHARVISFPHFDLDHGEQAKSKYTQLAGLLLFSPEGSIFPFVSAQIFIPYPFFQWESQTRLHHSLAFQRHIKELIFL